MKVGFKKAISGILAVMVLFFLVSCSEKPSVIISEKTDRADVQVENGKLFEVRLKGQLGTGFSWKLISGDERTKLLKMDIETSGKQETGGTDIQKFLFKAMNTGDIELKFHYDRAWEKDKSPAKEFIVKVVIKEAQ